MYVFYYQLSKISRGFENRKILEYMDGKPVGMKDRALFEEIQKTYMDRVEREIGWKMY